MNLDFALRSFLDLKKEKFFDEGYETKTSIDQIVTEKSIEKCFDRFEHLIFLDPTLPKIYRKEHIQFVESSLCHLPKTYSCLDSSRPWLIYWILNAGNILNHKFADSLLDRVIDFLIKCRSPEGGFGGGPDQYPHLAPTYAAVNSLCIIGTEKAYKAIDRKSLKCFLWSVRESCGAFRMHVDGECDIRGVYCALSVAKLANYSSEDEEKLFENTIEWIVSCQTYEGGIGGAPDLEAHGGYTFCGIAALALLGSTGKCDLQSLLRWTVNRQMRYEGGFQGRTNKLVDGCYSFWQAAILPIVQALLNKKGDHNYKKPLFHRGALQEYVLICCQRPNGGLLDKPGKPTDLYHTCYTLSGLSIAQHCEMNMNPLVVGCIENEVLPTHPLYNIPPKAVYKVYQYFQENNYDIYLEKNDNGIWSDVSEFEEYFLKKKPTNEQNDVLSTDNDDHTSVDTTTDDDAAGITTTATSRSTSAS